MEEHRLTLAAWEITVMLSLEVRTLQEGLTHREIFYPAVPVQMVVHHGQMIRVRHMDLVALAAM